MTIPRWFTRLVLGLLPFVHGCDSDYERKDGVWHHDGRKLDVKQPDAFKPLKGPFAKGADGGYYRGSLIAGSDSASFEALDDNYARDKAHAYYCDTYRKGQEYYAIKHNRMAVIEGADAADIRAKAETLQQASYALAEQVYKEAQQQAGATGDAAGAEGEPDEEIIEDAEVVDPDAARS